jgi:hypothetical protein
LLQEWNVVTPDYRHDPLPRHGVYGSALQRAGRQVPAFEFGDLREGEVFEFGAGEPGYVAGREMYTPVRVDIEAVLEYTDDPVNFFGSRCGSLMEDEDALDPRGGVRSVKKEFLNFCLKSIVFLRACWISIIIASARRSSGSRSRVRAEALPRGYRAERRPAL